MGLADWVRRADLLDNIPCNTVTDEFWGNTYGTIVPPPNTLGQEWYLMGELGNTGIYFWVDYREILTVLRGGFIFR